MRDIEYYPDKHSHQRPFWAEIETFEGAKFVQMFQANYIPGEHHWPKGMEVLEWMGHACGECHPWNLDLEGSLFDRPGIVSFWATPFIKFVVDAMNDKYEKEYIEQPT